MSITRYIHAMQHFGPLEQVPDSVIKELKQQFPALVSRRLTRMALMIAACLKDQVIAADATVIYATTFSETNCLEKYLESFPTPSPLMFQNSIHPSGMEQVLIARKQPVEEFFCYAGDTHILHSALIAAFTSDQPEQWLVAAEERGTWLTERGFASEQNFAWALRLNQDSEGALARMEWTPDTQTPATSPLSTLDFLNLLLERRDRQLQTESLGTVTLQWLL